MNVTKRLTLLATLTLAAAANADYTLTVNKNDNRGTWEGWGCSLAWWGNGVGGSTHQTTLADLVFTLNNVTILGNSVPGLGLNLVRYNVGGGGQANDIPGTPENMPATRP